MRSNQFDKVRLFNELQQWSLEDLQTLCFYLELGQPKLGLSYDKLAGATSRQKAQALIKHLDKYERFQSWAHLRSAIEEHFTFMDASFLPELTQIAPPPLPAKPQPAHPVVPVEATPDRTPTPMPAIAERLRQIPVWGWAGGGVLVVVALLLVWQGGFSPAPTPIPTVAATAIAVEEPTATFTPSKTPTLTPTPTPTPKPTVTPTPTTDPNVPPPNAQLGDEWVRPKDSMVMVFVPAPSQPFELGSGLDAPTEGYWIDKYEVSNAQYELCVADGACESSARADDADFNGAEYPVVSISWDDAVAYAEWVGAELPTEEQWEYAAGGEDGRIYPWGDEFDGTRLNCYATDCPNDGYEYTAPVGSYLEGASWVGALDMAGNVWEWTSSPYDDSSFVVRGGSGGDNRDLAHVSSRNWYDPRNWNYGLGVRLVRVPHFSGS